MATGIRQRETSTAKRLRALEHPMRLGIWRVLIERTATIGELHSALGLPRKDIPNVRYHTNYLVKLGMAEEVDRRNNKGHSEPVYKAMEKAFVKTKEWDRFREENPEMADHILGEAGQMHVDHLVSSLKSGALGNDAQWHVSCTPLVLDRKGLEDGAQLYDEFVERLSELQREAAERRDESGEDAIQVQSDLFLYRAAPA